jgi:transposase-like protein
VAQHFLLSPRAKTLSLRSVLSLSEDDAYAMFKNLRWAESDGKPVCPSCGGVDHYVLVDDRKWKCIGCKLQFTVTSKTILASRKLPFRDLLAVIAIFTNGVVGVAACRMQREIQISYKSAFVLLHKLREAMGNHDETDQLAGIVEIDGAIFGGSMPRLPNAKKLWAEYKIKNKAIARRKRRLIVVIREREHDDPTRIAKVRTFLVANEGDAIEIARKIVRPGTQMQADYGTQWEPLHAHFDTKRVNHSEHYSNAEACTNQAESFFARMRRAQRGVYNRIAGSYVPNYARELAWREENRRVSNRQQFEMIVATAVRTSPSSLMTGYWQRRRPGNDNDARDLARALGA